MVVNHRIQVPLARPKTDVMTGSRLPVRITFHPMTRMRQVPLRLLRALFSALVFNSMKRGLAANMIVGERLQLVTG